MSATDTPTRAESASVILWHRQLLPWIVGGILLIVAAFAGFSAVQISHLEGRFQKADELAESADFVDVLKGEAAEQSTDIAYLMLERENLSRRYHYATTLASAQIALAYSMIMTGMVMSVIGALFVLGKLTTEAGNTVNGTLQQMSISFVSSSPGLVLALFGALISLSSQFFNVKVPLRDGAVYVQQKSVHLLADAQNPAPALRGEAEILSQIIAAPGQKGD